MARSRPSHITKKRRKKKNHSNDPFKALTAILESGSATRRKSNHRGQGSKDASDTLDLKETELNTTNAPGSTLISSSSGLGLSQIFRESKVPFRYPNGPRNLLSLPRNIHREIVRAGDYQTALRLAQTHRHFRPLVNNVFSEGDKVHGKLEFICRRAVFLNKVHGTLNTHPHGALHHAYRGCQTCAQVYRCDATDPKAESVLGLCLSCDEQTLSIRNPRRGKIYKVHSYRHVRICLVCGHIVYQPYKKRDKTVLYCSCISHLMRAANPKLDPNKGSKLELAAAQKVSHINRVGNTYDMPTCMRTYRPGRNEPSLPLSIMNALVKRKTTKLKAESQKKGGNSAESQKNEKDSTQAQKGGKNTAPSGKAMFTLPEAIAIYEAERQDGFPLHKPDRARY